MEIRFDSSKGEVPPTIIDGPVPVDQIALVTQLTTERDAALLATTAAIAAASTLQAKIDAARIKAQSEKDADTANVAGQGVLDALA